MFWSKKEDKKGLPDLPPYRKPSFVVKQEGSDIGGVSGEDDEDAHESRHELPSFPDSLNHKGFSQAAIKDAVGIGSESSLQTLAFPDDKDRKFQSIEMEEWTPSLQKTRNIEQGEFPISREQSSVSARLEEPPISSSMMSIKSEGVSGGKNTDIFVKLDKFYSARKALIDAQQKLEDVDELLRKIRETKLKEEHELNAWENELTAIKSRINEITVNLFEKID